MHRTNIGVNQVPPGALVSFLQRGIQYVEMQSNLNEVCLQAFPCMGGRLLFACALTMDLPACVMCRILSVLDQLTRL